MKARSASALAAVDPSFEAMLDLATRKMVGWSMRDHMRNALPLSASILAARRQRPAESRICHSDRGSQYASEVYGKQRIAMKSKTIDERDGLRL